MNNSTSNKPIAVTHNLKDLTTFPNHYFWDSSLHNYEGIRLQTYSNTRINIGDTVVCPMGVKYVVIGQPFIESGEQIQVRQYRNKAGKIEKGVNGVLPELIGEIAHVDKYTRFYKLVLKEN